LKGFKDKEGKFRPTENKKGVKMNRDKIIQPTGIRLKRQDKKNSSDDIENFLVTNEVHIVDATGKGEPVETIVRDIPQRHVRGKTITLPSGAKASYEKTEHGDRLVLHYHGEEEKKKDIDWTMKRLAEYPQRRKEASLTRDEAVMLVKKTGKPLMFYIDPEEGQYFPVEKLRFNDTKVKGIWLLGDYNDRDGNYFSSFPIKDDKDWNKLVDEGRFIGFNEDGTINEDFKTRDRSHDAS